MKESSASVVPAMGHESRREAAERFHRFLRLCGCTPAADELQVGVARLITREGTIFHRRLLTYDRSLRLVRHAPLLEEHPMTLWYGGDAYEQ